jgi:hypothetical protein
MRKKEDWMFKGNVVMALGKRGVITSMQENELNGVDYVYYINVKLDGEKRDGRYHPDDINKIV